MDQAIVFDPAKHHHLLPQFTEVHMACITVDYTIATFLPPLQHAKMLKWWEDRAVEVAAGVRSIVFLQSASSDGSVLNNSAKVAGVVMLSKPPSETGPFRGIVEKLLVSPSFRRKGVAKKMMDKVEEVSQAEGRWLILLDTEQGSPAEKVYPRLGYIRCGMIPNYEISPKDGTLHHAIFFYKDLRTAN